MRPQSVCAVAANAPAVPTRRSAPRVGAADSRRCCRGAAPHRRGRKAVTARAARGSASGAGGGVPSLRATRRRAAPSTSPRRSVSGSSSSSGGANTAYESHLQREAEKQARTAQLRRLIARLRPPRHPAADDHPGHRPRATPLAGEGAGRGPGLMSWRLGREGARRDEDGGQGEADVGEPEEDRQHEIRISSASATARRQAVRGRRDSRSIHLIVEYVDGGTVQHLVKKHKRIAEEDAQRILYQLVDAVAHCPPPTSAIATSS